MKGGNNMDIKKFNVGDSEYEFVNEAWETSSAWGHKTVLLKNNYQISEGKCRYYNRTWERYTYQSCMQRSVNNLIDELLSDYIGDYKASNGISRFKKGQKDEVVALFENEDSIKELKELLEQL